ncbi:CBS domain-containing protein [bacterium]|nr:CBS domain-containing protein [bacterium]
MEKDKKVTKIQEFIYELKVNQVMAKNIVVVDKDMSLKDIRTLLRDQRISGLPVIDDGKLIGLVSLEDFIQCLASGKKNCTVPEMMTKKVVTVFSDSPLVEALKKFDRFGYGRFPVINRETNEVVGMITKGDIVRGLLKKLEIDYLEEEIHTYRASHIFEDMTAQDFMLRFHYSIKGKDFKHAGECASDIKKTLKRLGVQPQIVRRVAIATYEAEMNIIIYADKGEIIAEVERDRLIITAKDEGPGIEDIEKAMQPGFSTASHWVREFGFGAGMGLPNIKNCSDGMNVKSVVGEGTVVEFCFKFNSKHIEGKDKDECI